MKIQFLVAAAVFALAPLGGGAHARSIEVPLHHVDFSDAAAVDGLHRDIATAARTACGRSKTPGLAGLQQARTCRLEAVNAAVADLNKPMLTALNDALDARLRINGKRPLLNAVQLAAVENAAVQTRAEARNVLASAAQ